VSGNVAFRQMYAKLPAQDTVRARAFFAEKLGLEPFADHDGHMRYQIGDAQFLVFRSSGSPSGTHDQLGLVVDDVEEAVASLRERGVVFETYEQLAAMTSPTGITDFGAVKAAWFKDSEGNLISVNQFPATA
jgi:catechol-2,3-dioxygenase